MAPVIRVLLVDDDPLVRAALHLIIDATDDLTVVAEAGDGDEAIAAARAAEPDVVLMDLRLPRVDGITATREIRRLPRPPHVIALTTWDVDDAVLRSLDAGASGFLLKSSPHAEIISAVRAVMNGDAVLSPRSTRHLLDHLARTEATDQRRSAAGAMAHLTDREREVCVAVAQGLSNAAIATRLYIAEATVKAHLSSIQTKLGVGGRVEIAVLAERAGLLRPH